MERLRGGLPLSAPAARAWQHEPKVFSDSGLDKASKVPIPVRHIQYFLQIYIFIYLYIEKLHRKARNRSDSLKNKSPPTAIILNQSKAKQGFLIHIHTQTHGQIKLSLR